MKKIFFIVTIMASFVAGCNKSAIPVGKSQLLEQSSELIIDWTNVQIRLIRNTPGVTHPAYSRHFSYTGIAIYESLVNGDNKKISIASLLNGSIHFPVPPSANHIYFPISANAAFASMFRFFYSGKEANLQIIDSIEQAYKARYTNKITNNYDVDRSIQYGKDIAAVVIEFSKQDGASNASVSYTPQGEGYWEATPPTFGAPAVPGWGNNRTVLSGSINNTLPAEPIQFSKDAGTPFYNMVKEVYDVSLSLTDEQKIIANFWDDLPNGKYISAFGHWFNILKQILQKENTPLMKGADAYLRLGITMNESTISCWKSKYTFHQLRPITYIRKYINAGWNSFIGTPAHPEYLAAHATISSSAAYALESVFGKNYSFADHTYESIAMPVRSYSSIEAAGTEAGMSRLYGGIHYRQSIEAGKACGNKVGENVKNILRTDK